MTRYRVDNANQDEVKFFLSLSVCSEKAALALLLIEKSRRIEQHSQQDSWACLHGGGVPQIGEVTFGGSPHLSCKRDQMDMRVTPPEPVTSPTRGTPPS